MVSRTTLWRRLKELGLTIPPHSDITDSELDGVMEVLVHKYPRNGIVMMWGHLRSISIFVTRKRVYESLTRVVVAALTQYLAGCTVSHQPTACGTLMVYTYG